MKMMSTTLHLYTTREMYQDWRESRFSFLQFASFEVTKTEISCLSSCFSTPFCPHWATYFTRFLKKQKRWLLSCHFLDQDPVQTRTVLETKLIFRAFESSLYLSRRKKGTASVVVQGLQYNYELLLARAHSRLGAWKLGADILEKVEPFQGYFPVDKAFVSLFL